MVQLIINNTVNVKVNPVIIFFRLPYYGDEVVLLIKSCIKTVKADCLQDLSRSPLPCQSNIVYEFECPECSVNYVGKLKVLLMKELLSFVG